MAVTANVLSLTVETRQGVEQLEALRDKLQTGVPNAAARAAKLIGQIERANDNGTRSTQALVAALDKEIAIMKGLDDAGGKAAGAIDDLNEPAESSAANIGKLGGVLGLLNSTSFGAVASLTTLGAVVYKLQQAVNTALQTFETFESGISNVGVVSGATADEIRQLKEYAEAIGKGTSFDQDQATAGLLDLARAGRDASQGILQLRPAMDLSRAGTIELGQSSTILANVMSQYGLQSEEARLAVDRFVRSANAGTQTVEQLSTAVLDAGVGSVFTLKETTNLATQLANLGFAGDKGTIAITNFGSRLSQLAKPTDEQSAVLKELNLTFEDLNPLTNDAVDIIDRLSTAQISLVQANTLFEAQAGRKLHPLLKGGRKLYEETEAAILGNARAADVAAKSLGALEEAGVLQASAQKAALSAFGEAFAPAQEDFLKYTTEIYADLADWARDNQAALTVLGHAVELVATGLVETLDYAAQAVRIPFNLILREVDRLIGVAFSGFQLMAKGLDALGVDAAAGWSETLGDIAKAYEEEVESLTKGLENAGLRLFQQDKAQESPLDAIDDEVTKRLEAERDLADAEKRRIAAKDAAEAKSADAARKTTEERVDLLKKIDEQVSDFNQRQAEFLIQQGAAEAELSAARTAGAQRTFEIAAKYNKLVSEAKTEEERQALTALYNQEQALNGQRTQAALAKEAAAEREESGADDLAHRLRLQEFDDQATVKAKELALRIDDGKLSQRDRLELQRLELGLAYDRQLVEAATIEEMIRATEIYERQLALLDGDPSQTPFAAGLDAILGQLGAMGVSVKAMLADFEQMAGIDLGGDLANQVASGIASSGPSGGRAAGVGAAAAKGGLPAAVLQVALSNEKISAGIDSIFGALFDLVDPIFNLFAEPLQQLTDVVEPLGPIMEALVNVFRPANELLKGLIAALSAVASALGGAVAGITTSVENIGNDIIRGAQKLFGGGRGGHKSDKISQTAFDTHFSSLAGSEQFVDAARLARDQLLGGFAEVEKIANKIKHGGQKSRAWDLINTSKAAGAALAGYFHDAYAAAGLIADSDKQAEVMAGISAKSSEALAEIRGPLEEQVARATGQGLAYDLEQNLKKFEDQRQAIIATANEGRDAAHELNQTAFELENIRLQSEALRAATDRLKPFSDKLNGIDQLQAAILGIQADATAASEALVGLSQDQQDFGNIVALTGAIGLIQDELNDALGEFDDIVANVDAADFDVRAAALTSKYAEAEKRLLAANLAAGAAGLEAADIRARLAAAEAVERQQLADDIAEAQAAHEATLSGVREINFAAINNDLAVAARSMAAKYSEMLSSTNYSMAEISEIISARTEEWQKAVEETLQPLEDGLVSASARWARERDKLLGVAAIPSSVDALAERLAALGNIQGVADSETITDWQTSLEQIGEDALAIAQLQAETSTKHLGALRGSLAIATKLEDAIFGLRYGGATGATAQQTLQVARIDYQVELAAARAAAATSDTADDAAIDRLATIAAKFVELDAEVNKSSQAHLDLSAQVLADLDEIRAQSLATAAQGQAGATIDSVSLALSAQEDAASGSAAYQANKAIAALLDQVSQLALIGSENVASTTKLLLGVDVELFGNGIELVDGLPTFSTSLTLDAVVQRVVNGLEWDNPIFSSGLALVGEINKSVTGGILNGDQAKAALAIIADIDRQVDGGTLTGDQANAKLALVASLVKQVNGGEITADVFSANLALAAGISAKLNGQTVALNQNGGTVTADVSLDLSAKVEQLNAARLAGIHEALTIDGTSFLAKINANLSQTGWLGQSLLTVINRLDQINGGFNGQAGNRIDVMSGHLGSWLATLDANMRYSLGILNNSINAIPGHATGTPYTREGLAYLHEGEAVLPFELAEQYRRGDLAADRAVLELSGAGRSSSGVHAAGPDNAAVVAELRALRQETADLRRALESSRSGRATVVVLDGSDPKWAGVAAHLRRNPADGVGALLEGLRR